MSFIAVATIGSAVVGVAGSVMSANGQRSAARRASAQQRETSDQQIALIERQRARAEEIARPHQEAGAAANRTLRNLWDSNPGNARTIADAYGAFNPGGPNGARPGMGTATPVYESGAARFTTQAFGSDVPQVQPPPQPILRQPPPAPPAYQPPVPLGWVPRGNGQLPGAYVPPAPPAPPPAPPPTLSPTPWVPGGWRPDPRVFNVQKL